MFYLAAAVSDFYISDGRLAQHKIQSDESLTLQLEQVPKCLGKLTGQWAPRSFAVSFKLETDEALVVLKAQTAILKYNVHLVVANQLNVSAAKGRVGVSCRIWSIIKQIYLFLLLNYKDHVQGK